MHEGRFQLTFQVKGALHFYSHQPWIVIESSLRGQFLHPLLVLLCEEQCTKDSGSPNPLILPRASHCLLLLLLCPVVPLLGCPFHSYTSRQVVLEERQPRDRGNGACALMVPAYVGYSVHVQICNHKRRLVKFECCTLTLYKALFEMLYRY